MRISPRKARLVTDLIKGRDLGEAQQILDYSPKGAARAVAKVLASAAANAENNNKIAPDRLFVLRAFVDEGPTLKRFRPRAMGRATRINKRSSHITIILEEREPEKVARRRFRRSPKPDAKARKAGEKAASEDITEEEMLELSEAEAVTGAGTAEAEEAPAGEAGMEEAPVDEDAVAEEVPAEEEEPPPVDDGAAEEQAPGEDEGAEPVDDKTGDAAEEAKPDTEGSEG